jgi:glycosyltransferase involved in cell wall biosynthesis
MYAPKRYLGQTRGVKGHEDLIDAVALVQQTIPEAIVVFVGGAWDNSHKYEKIIRAYGRAKLGNRAVFLGNRVDVSEIYMDFDVVVHPSHSENIGGAAESLLLEVPTIATSIGGFPDVVIPGQTGWLVSPGQPDELANVIIRVLGNIDHARELAKNGRQLAEQLFDVRQTASEIAKIYEVILSR